jgi:uroporphyrinogen III methyltransferase / synthase
MLWVRAAESRDVVGDGLTALGAIVDECIAYRTVPETADPTGAKARLAEQGADLITFTSGSTVDHFFALGLDWPEGCVAGSIGPVTSQTLRKHGHASGLRSQPHDIPGLTAAIVRYFTRRRGWDSNPR